MCETFRRMLTFLKILSSLAFETKNLLEKKKLSHSDREKEVNSYLSLKTWMQWTVLFIVAFHLDFCGEFSFYANTHEWI